MGFMVTFLGCVRILFAFLVSAHAGGWVSTGGELFRSDKNPWFLRNVARVRYCVLVDRQGISQSPEKVRAAIATAIGFWRTEFADYRSLRQERGDEPGVASLGTQDFDEIACDGTEDIRFVVGAGVLLPQERRYLKDVRRHLGITVRTSYDDVNLRGRGFIYLASDQGREAFRGVDPLAEKLWSRKQTLVAMISHELGHVFGLPHFGQALMSESFAEKVVSPYLSNLLLNSRHLPGVLREPENSESCGLDGTILAFFGVTDAQIPGAGPAPYCLALARHPVDPANTETTVVYDLAIRKQESGNSRPSKEARPLGRITFHMSADPAKIQWPMDVRVSAASLIYLNPRQKVFGDAELLRFPDPKDPARTIAMDFLFGTANVSYGGACRIELANGPSHACQIQASPAGQRIFSQVGGRTRLVFNSDQLFFF